MNNMDAVVLGTDLRRIGKRKREEMSLDKALAEFIKYDFDWLDGYHDAKAVWNAMDREQPMHIRAFELMQSARKRKLAEVGS